MYCTFYKLCTNWLNFFIFILRGIRGICQIYNAVPKPFTETPQFEIINLIKLNTKITHLFLIILRERLYIGYRVTWRFVHSPFILGLKGVFAKNISWYRLSAKNNRFWSLLILLPSVNLEKIVILNNVASKQIQKVAIYDYTTWIVKKSIWFQTNNSDIATYIHRLFFGAFVYSFVYNALKTPK